MSMSAFQLSTSHLLGVELFGSQIISVIIYGVIIIVGLAAAFFSFLSQGGARGIAGN